MLRARSARHTPVRLAPVLGVLLAVLPPALPAGAAGSGAAAVDTGATARSEVVLSLDREAEFEVSREADGTAVVIHIERPTSAVSALPLSADDPLVGSVTLGPDPAGTGTVARVHLRDRTVRTVTRTLLRPFRIVLGVVHNRPPKAAASEAGNTPFAFDVPLPKDAGPPLLEPLVTAPTDGPDAAGFRAARAAFRKGDLEAAETGFADFARAHPDTPLAEATGYYLAELHFHRVYGEPPAQRVAAAKAFDALGTRYPRSRNVALGLVRMGEVLLREDRLDEAARLADVAMGDYADTPFARSAEFLRARVALQANHLRTALARFEHVRKGGVADAAGVGSAFGLAETLGRMGRYPEAVRFYERGLKYSPGAPKADPRQLQLMGRALMEDGRFEDARRVFLVLYNLYPDRYPPGLALSRVADSFRGEGLWERAEEGYQYVIQHHPRGEGSLAARISLADLYVDRHRAIRAPVIATHIVGNRIDSSNPDELVSEALRLYGEVVEAAPSDTLAEEATFKLAALFEELGDYEEALSRLFDLVTRYPQTDWRRPARELGETALAERAAELLKAHQPARAVALYRRYREPIFERQLSGWRPLYPLALAHEALGLNREAMRKYLTLLGSSAPDAYRIRAVYRLGNLYMERGQPEEALKRYTYFVRRHPAGPLTGALYLRMAEAHAALGRPRQAAAAYEIYLARYAKGTDARRVRLALARVYAGSGETAKARALYQSVLAADARPDQAGAAPLDPPTAKVRLALADLEYGAKRYAAAAKAYTAAAAGGLRGDDARWARLRAGMADLALHRNAPAKATLTALAEQADTGLIPAVARELAAGVN